MPKIRDEKNQTFKQKIGSEIAVSRKYCSQVISNISDQTTLLQLSGISEASTRHRTQYVFSSSATTGF